MRIPTTMEPPATGSGVKRGGRRRAVAVACAVILSAGATLGAGETGAAPVSEEAPLLLPPMMIEEHAERLPWRHAELPGFEILSVCGDGVTREFMRRFHRLEQMLLMIVPPEFLATSSVPEAMILFNEELGRARSQEVVADMLRRHGLKMPTGELVLPDFLREMRPGRRVEFLPNMRLSDVDAMAGFAAVRDGEARRMTFEFHTDRIAYLLERRVPALPDWLVEGVLGFIGRTNCRETSIEVQPAEWISKERVHGLATERDWPRTLWPMQELLAGVRPAKGGERSELTDVWRAQCALFVRWAIVEHGGARREALWTLAKRMEGEPLSEELFRECFGLGFADVRDRLSDYLPEAVGRGTTLRVPKLAEMPAVRFRTPEDAEVARIRGDWERLEIALVRNRFPELTETYTEQARRTLRRQYERGARDPQLLAVLGLTECDAGNPAGARWFLEAAAQARVVRPRVYFELARIRYDEAMAGVAADGLTAEQVAHVLEPLTVIRQMAPPLPQAYVLMAEVWTRSAEPPGVDDLAWLNEGVRQFPRVSPLVLRTIYLNVTVESFGPARALADAGLLHAKEAEMRALFERVRAELEPHVAR